MWLLLFPFYRVWNPRLIEVVNHLLKIAIWINAELRTTPRAPSLFSHTTPVSFGTAVRRLKGMRSKRLQSRERTQAFGMFYPDTDPQTHSMAWTSTQVLNCSNPCKNTNGILSGSKTRRHTPADYFSLIQAILHFAKWTINLVSLHFFSKPSGYPLVTEARVQPPISKLIFQSLIHVLLTGPMY